MKARRGAIAAVAVAMVLLGGGAAAAAIVTAMASPGAASAVRPSPPSAGRVLGKFLRVGGPLGPGGKQPAAVPLSGTIRFARPGQAATTVRVGKTGTFAVSLTPGRYRVAGTTPDIMGEPGNTEATCSLPGSLVVAAGLTRHVTVVCAVP